ncbi:MAG: ABC transporter ATP-binding protein [Armatimonadota bacterium]
MFGSICMLATVYLSQQPPRIIQYLIDDVIVERKLELLPRVILIVTAIYLGINLFGFLRTYWMHVAGQRLLHALRSRLYGHFQQLPLTYYDNRQTGDLMSRMTGDVEQIEHLLVHGTDEVLVSVLSLGLALYYMSTYHGGLTLLVLIPVPILVVSILFFSRAIRTIYRAIRDQVGSLNAKLQDNISGMRVIKAFSREKDEQEQVEAESAGVMAMNIRGIRMWSPFFPAMSFIGSIGTIIVLGAGAYFVSRGELTQGGLVAVLIYVGNFYQPIGALFRTSDGIMRALAAGERIFEVLDTVPEIQDPENPVELAQVRGEVCFENVSFHYANGDEVLREINVAVKPGERVALVGRSGAGKSSFINLIPRFYDAVEGCITVDGVDVRGCRQTDLRRHIALVLQETFLFNGTVRANLQYGKLDATDEEMIDAATIANAHEFIERLPQGYDTEIGERGVKLSGGQRQRLAIARAVLVDPRILILDEATSSVDSESEFLIHQALERLMEGRTTFIIAHRLSTIKHADTILVLENGTIQERGNHATLLRADGLYAQMYRQQFWLDEMEEEREREESAPDEMDLPVME